MRYVALVCVLVGAILFVGLNTAPAQAGCTMVDLQGHCSGGVVKLSWNFLTTPDCTANVFRLERKCGPSGQWVVVAEGSIRSPYEDHPIIGCAAGFYYRLSWTCACPSGIGVSSNEIGPIVCN
jgi:hypothetical protein